MSFLEEVKALEPVTIRCGVAKWLTTQTEITDDDIRQAAREVTVKSTHLALANRGFKLARNALERHLNGACSCPTS